MYFIYYIRRSLNRCLADRATQVDGHFGFLTIWHGNQIAMYIFRYPHLPLNFKRHMISRGSPNLLVYIQSTTHINIIIKYSIPHGFYFLTCMYNGWGHSGRAAFVCCLWMCTYWWYGIIPRMIEYYHTNNMVSPYGWHGIPIRMIWYRHLCLVAAGLSYLP